MWDHIARELATHFLTDKIVNHAGGSPPKIDTESQGLVFRYPPWQRFLYATVSALFIAGLMALCLTIEYKSPSDMWGMFALAVAFGLIPLATVWSVFRTRIVVTANGLQGTSPWRGAQSISWNELREIRFGGGKFEFRSYHGDKLAILMSAVDLNPLFDLCETVYPGSFFASLAEGYKKLKRPLPAYDAPPRESTILQDFSAMYGR